MSIVLEYSKIIKKTKKKMKERIEYVLSLTDWRYYEAIFMTLTFKSNNDYIYFKFEQWKNFVSNLVKNYGVEFCVRAEELQSRGVGHIHLLLIKKKGKRIGFIDKEKGNIYKVGLTNIKRINNIEVRNITGYIMKYLTKAINTDWLDFKIKNKIKKKIRRYGIYYKNRRKDKGYRVVSANSLLKKELIRRDIKIRKKDKYNVVENGDKKVEWRYKIEKYIELGKNDSLEIYINSIIIRYYIENKEVLENEIEIDNIEDFKDITELILNLLELN